VNWPLSDDFVIGWLSALTSQP